MALVDPTRAQHSSPDAASALEALEAAWGRPARAPAHDRQPAGWLVLATVLALVTTALVLATLGTSTWQPAMAAAPVGALACCAAALYRRQRRRLARRWLR